MKKYFWVILVVIFIGALFMAPITFACGGGGYGGGGPTGYPYPGWGDHHG